MAALRTLQRRVGRLEIYNRPPDHSGPSALALATLSDHDLVLLEEAARLGDASLVTDDQREAIRRYRAALDQFV